MTFAKKLLAAVLKWNEEKKGVEVDSEDLEMLKRYADSFKDELQSFTFCFGDVMLNIRNPRFGPGVSGIEVNTRGDFIATQVFREILAFEAGMVEALYLK